MMFFSNDIWRKIFKIKINKIFGSSNINLTEDQIIYSRKSNIPLCLRGLTINIHKGSVTRKIVLNKHYINSKFGEYAYTRKLYYYPLKKKNRR